MNNGNPGIEDFCRGIHIHQNAMEIPNQRIKDSGIVSNEILKGNHINQMPFKNMKSGNPGIEDFCSIPNYNSKWMSYKPNAFPNFRNPGFKDSGIVSNEIFKRNSYKPNSYLQLEIRKSRNSGFLQYFQLEFSNGCHTN